MPIFKKSYSGLCRWYQTNGTMRRSRYWTILFVQSVLDTIKNPLNLSGFFIVLYHHLFKSYT